jgi:hypothetical protein
MCYSPLRAYESPADFERRAIRNLKKKFARRKTNVRAVEKLFDRSQHLQTIGRRFGFGIHFRVGYKYKRGKRVHEYKLVIKKIEAHPTYSPSSCSLFGEDSTVASEGTVASQVSVGVAVENRVSVQGTEENQVSVEEEEEVEVVVEEEVGVLVVDEEESEVLVQEERETEVVVEEIEIEEEVEVVVEEEEEVEVVVEEEEEVAIEEAEEQVEVSLFEEVYDPLTVGRIILQGVGIVYNRVPIPRFIAVNIIYDTELLEFTSTRVGELLEDTGYATQPEDTGYATQPEDTGYESDDSSHISDYIGAHAPSA